MDFDLHTQSKMQKKAFIILREVQEFLEIFMREQYDKWDLYEDRYPELELVYFDSMIGVLLWDDLHFKPAICIAIINNPYGEDELVNRIGSELQMACKQCRELYYLQQWPGRSTVLGISKRSKSD